MEATGHLFLGLAAEADACNDFRKSRLMLASSFLVGIRFNSSRFSFSFIFQRYPEPEFLLTLADRLIPSAIPAQPRKHFLIDCIATRATGWRRLTVIRRIKNNASATLRAGNFYYPHFSSVQDQFTFAHGGLL
jgi:hypothetical protein